MFVEEVFAVQPRVFEAIVVRKIEVSLGRREEEGTLAWPPELGLGE